ncbi:MAG: DNA adenine methylase [Phycisphaerales bacterium]|nr:DNA adenine methylase [Phycisphaerales bacterium]
MSRAVQLRFFDEGIVNVASVPQRSPFRYPGGKTWLIPWIRRWLTSLPERPVEFVEAFAGGASVGLTVGVESLADHVSLVELDRDVYSVWRTILSPAVSSFTDRILHFAVTEASVRAIIASPVRSWPDRAFRTLIRNRMQHGGILAAGASLMREGENGNGLLSRWYPETLVRRIEEIHAHRRRFGALMVDAFGVLRANAHRPECAYFVDPPYVAAGRRLYAHHQIDHEALFRSCSKLAGPFLMTYDDSPEIQGLAKKYGFDTARVPMKSRQHIVKKELLVGPDLGWLRCEEPMQAVARSGARTRTTRRASPPSAHLQRARAS